MNDLFSKAVVRLTALYVTVLALVCVVFSGYLYNAASVEIDRNSHRQIAGFQNMFGQFEIDPLQSERMRAEESSESKRHLRVNLVLVNMLVIGGGAIMCYFFAKKTLEPIEESVKAQERFTSDASHELRTPLASMKTEIEVALRDSKLSIQESRELLQSNLEEVNNLHVMTENLLSLARHQEVGEMKMTDIGKLLKSIAKKHESGFKKASMKLVVVPGTQKLMTNADALGQVVTILIDNALKYAGTGSKVIIGAHKEDDYLVVVVSDNGKGISEQQMSQIFKRFYKADASRTSSGTFGHGLGLSIAKQLCAALKGDISVSKGPDDIGVEFRVRLPVV